MEAYDHPQKLSHRYGRVLVRGRSNDPGADAFIQRLKDLGVEYRS